CGKGAVCGNHCGNHPVFAQLDHGLLARQRTRARVVNQITGSCASTNTCSTSLINFSRPSAEANTKKCLVKCQDKYKIIIVVNETYQESGEIYSSLSLIYSLLLA